MLAHDPAARHALVNSTWSQFPLVGADLRRNVHMLRRGGGFVLAVGIAWLVWGSLGLAQAGIFAMQQLWNLPGPKRPNYINGDVGLEVDRDAVGEASVALHGDAETR